MSRKAKKAKSSIGKGKSKANKALKDAITGMDIGNGLTIMSDTIYSDQSPEYKALFGERNSIYQPGGGTQIEFEFSPNAIIYTSVTTGETLLNGREQYSPNYKSRGIAIGSFNAGNKGLLKTGTISEASEWSYTPAKGATSTSAAVEQAERIITYQRPTSIGEAQIKSNPASIFYAFTSGTPVFWYISNIQPELAGEYDPKSDFTKFASSKYMNDGWWQDPFAPNLI